MVSLESGTYDLTFEGIRPLVSVPYEAGKWQAHERVSVDLKNDNGKITIEMSAHDNNPIIGKIQGGAFTASVDEPRGTTTLKGTLTADNEVSGDVMREIKHQHVIMKGKFKLVKLKSNALTPIP